LIESASTKGMIVKELKINHLVNCSFPDEISVEGWKKHVLHVEAAVPLTAREMEIEELKIIENHTEISLDSRSSNAPGLELKTEKGVMEKLKALKVIINSFSFQFSLQFSNV
jgi:twinfilin-like protein